MTQSNSTPATGGAKSSNGWLWSLIRGLVSLALGLFLLAGQSAPIWVAYAFAVYLILAGGFQTFSGLFNRHAPGSKTDRIRGLVGLVSGLALLGLAYFNVLSLEAVYTILAVILIVYGGLGLFEAFFDRGGARFRWMAVVINVLLTALGVMVFVARSREFDLRVWSGIVLAAIGVFVILYAFLVQRRSPAAADATV